MHAFIQNAKNRTSPTWLKRGALSLIALGLLFFAGLFITQFASSAPYSMAHQSISELGITTCGSFTETQTKETFYVCSPLHWLMNGTFVLNGALIFLTTIYFIRPLWVGRKLRKAGLGFIFLAALGEIIVGLVPVNVSSALHSTAAGIAIFSLNLGLILLGCAVVKKWRGIGSFTLLMGVIGLVGFLMDGTPPYAGLGYGGWERVAGFAFELWSLVLGIYILYAKGRQGATLTKDPFESIQANKKDQS